MVGVKRKVAPNHLKLEVMNTEENNRLIASFMRLHVKSIAPIQLQHYDKSWDSLIPVLRKIKGIIEKLPDDEIDKVGMEQRFNPYTYSHESIFRGVVEFIKRHNKNK